MGPLRRHALLLCMLLACVGVPRAAEVTLAWDPNTETDLAGYKVYWGTASQAYGAPVTIGLQTTYTVTGLVTGTWYFAVTAYNTAGLESGYSNEVSTTISGPPTGDLNGDWAVNVMDLQVLINAILTGGQTGDLNHDGTVNVLDLQVLIGILLSGS